MTKAPATRRKFNGKVYTNMGVYSRKSKAESEADNLRSRGFPVRGGYRPVYARVVPVSGGYAVYGRMK